MPHFTLTVLDKMIFIYYTTFRELSVSCLHVVGCHTDVYIYIQFLYSDKSKDKTQNRFNIGLQFDLDGCYKYRKRK
jgi:hypothetical protein